MDQYVELVALILALIATGCCSGFLAGLLGVGGGIVIVPVLFQVFEVFGVDPTVRMQVAVGTSLATIIPTSIVSARSHWRKGSVDRELLQRLAPMTFIGVILGTLVASWVSGQVLTAVFATVALLVALKMAMGPDAFAIGHALPGRAGTGVMGSVIGGVSAMMGIGGGTLTVPLLSLFRYPIHSAVGTAAALGMIISLPGAIGFAIAGYGNPALPPFSLGYVNLAGFLTIVPTSILAAPWGARTAHAISRVWLSRAFGFFLIITAIKLFVGLYRGH
jgi:uncharacterized membrane protein YfcA